jgi:hypothetical protein
LPGSARSHLAPNIRLTALLIAATLVAAIIAGCGGSAKRPPAQAASLRPGPEAIFEPKGELAANPSGTLRLMRHLGVGRVKLFISWQTVAPDPSSRVRPRFDAADPAAYPAAGWSSADAIVRDAAAQGMPLYVSVGGPAPLWATGTGAPPKTLPGVWKPSPAQFGQFVRAVATRYSGHYTPPGATSPLPRISFWSIWNEPNLGSDELAPQAIDDSTVESSPAMYRALVDAAWSAFQRTGHGSDTILIGELAPYGQTGPGDPGNFGEMVPLRFLRALYCVGRTLRPLEGAAAAVRGCPTTAAASKQFAADNPGLFKATGFAMHPYSSIGAPPTALPADPDMVNLSTLTDLEGDLDRLMSAYGVSTQFPIYITEYGYITDPPLAGGVPLSLAPEYLNWAEYLAWLDPRVRSWDQYLLMDPPPGPSSFDTGLENYLGVMKPTFAAYRMPIFLPVTNTRAGRSVDVWGCVRPAHYAQVQTGAAQRVRIQFKPGTGGAFTTVIEVTITSPNGYFDVPVRFPSSGTVRLAWTYPHGATIHSRDVQITLR